MMGGGRSSTSQNINEVSVSVYFLTEAVFEMQRDQILQRCIQSNVRLYYGKPLASSMLDGVCPPRLILVQTFSYLDVAERPGRMSQSRLPHCCSDSSSAETWYVKNWCGFRKTRLAEFVNTMT